MTSLSKILKALISIFQSIESMESLNTNPSPSTLLQIQEQSLINSWSSCFTFNEFKIRYVSIQSQSTPNLIWHSISEILNNSFCYLSNIFYLSPFWALNFGLLWYSPQNCMDCGTIGLHAFSLFFKPFLKP